MQGQKGELSKETILKKYPTADSPLVGKLPRGTILQVEGEEDENFAKVSIELADGTVTEGWVDIKTIKGREKESGRTSPQKVTEETSKKNKKRHLPKDEASLLGREKTFYYGLDAGGNLGMVNYSAGTETYSGMSFDAGAHLGLFLNSYARGQFNVGYMRLEGRDSLNNTLGFGYIYANAEVQLLVDERIFVFGNLGYLNGIGITGAPLTVKLQGSSDASTFNFQAGAGYRMPMSDVSGFGFKASYLYGVQRDPIGVQGILLSLFLDFEG